MPLDLIASNSLSDCTNVAVTSASVTHLLSSLTPDSIANGISTLFGALFGAMLAYFFQRMLLKKQQGKDALMSAHHTMFAILQQINTILLIQKDYVYTEISNPVRFISIPATPPYDTNKHILDIKALSFLLDESKSRSILYEFYIAQENYIEALNQWNLRSSLHLDVIQPLLAASNIKMGSEITLQQLEGEIGTYQYKRIVNATDNCVVTLKRSFEKLNESKKKMRAYFVVRFKTNDFTDFDYSDTYGLDVN